MGFFALCLLVRRDDHCSLLSQVSAPVLPQAVLRHQRCKIGETNAGSWVDIGEVGALHSISQLLYPAVEAERWDFSSSHSDECGQAGEGGSGVK